VKGRRQARESAHSAVIEGVGSALGPLLLGAAVALFLFEFWSLSPHCDDSYISYRYAANLVAGRGLVYNPGEYVEGFSNLLWTLLVAAGLALGVGAKTAAHVLGLASGCATLLATYAFARSGLRSSQSWCAAIAAWIVFASPVFARWTTSGMETPLFAATLMAAFAAQARGRFGWAAFAVSLATLTRPEGVLAAASLFGFRLIGEGFRSWRAWLPPIAYAALLVALTGFRIAYYGAPLPNTFYAKVGGVSLGLSFVGGAFFLLSNAGLCAIPAVAVVARDRRWWPAAAFSAALLAWGFAVGAAPRYLLPLVPCLAALGVCGAATLFERGRTARIAAVAIVALTFHLSFFGVVGPRRESLREAIAKSPRIGQIARAREEDAKGERLGKRRAAVLLERGEPIALVATGAIGSFGFYSRLPILDILGLVDATIARTDRPPDDERFAWPGHQRSNPDYVFSRKPDYILIGKRGKQRLGDVVTAPADIRMHPDLDRYYEWDAEVLGYRRVR
jgi:arabinofuranosyltransferase